MVASVAGHRAASLEEEVVDLVGATGPGATELGAFRGLLRMTRFIALSRFSGDRG